MKYIIILLFFICFKSYGQVIDLYIKFYDRKDAQKKFRKELHMNDSTIFKSTGDTLTGFLTTSTQSGFIKLNFLKSDDEFAFKYCVRQEVILDCSECSAKYLDGLLHSKGYRWKKIANNQYATNYDLQTQLDVIYNDKEKYCMTLIFTYIDKPRKEYRAWYKGLGSF